MLADVGQRPGDLALVQFALTETWDARGRYGNDLLLAYAEIGRVEGALARSAELVRTRLERQRPGLLDTVLVRLVRLGDTAGATRRAAMRAEFDDESWALLQDLASEDGKRLVLLGGSEEQPTAEIAHEALVTAWSHFQALLQDNAAPKRILDNLIPRARDWAAASAPNERDKRRAVGRILSCSLGCSSSDPSGCRQTNGCLSGNRSGWPTRRPRAN